MSMNGKFLRPPPSADGGNLFDSSDESSDEEAPRNSKNSNANLSDGSAASGDDYEGSAASSASDEEYASDEPYKKKRKPPKGGAKPSKKKKKMASFIDEEAEDAGSDDDDEVYGEHYDPDDIVKSHYSAEDQKRENMDEEAAALIRQQDRRRAQAGGQFGIFSVEKSAEDISRDIENRHRMARRTMDRGAFDRSRAEEGAGGVTPQNLTAVSQQSLVPSVSDPSLWMFKCIPGKEEELVYQMMNKCIAFARQGKPLGITGSVAAQTKGRIYIESYSEPAVIEAVQGIRNLMQYSMTLVPINDMTTVMTVIPKKKPVKKNDWVRMSRGHFKGDLALVKVVKESGLKCVIQAVPRLDLTLGDLPPEEARIRRRTVRPPQKFFNPSEIAALGKDCYRQRFPGGVDNCDYYDGNYYHDGYLLKEVTVGTMVKPCGEDDQPTLDELQHFSRRKKGLLENNYDDGNLQEENEGSRMASSLLDELSELQGKTSLSSAKAASAAHGGGLVVGDTVEVIEGDLVGMRGKLLSIDGATVKIKPNNSADLGMMTEVEFLTSQVRKHIPVGAHVKVIDGHYANETGVVVAVEESGDGSNKDFTAVVLTDITHKEVSVRISQLQESAEIASGRDKLAGYELYDLVVLSGGGSNNEVGVITRVGREEFSVINHHGVVRENRPEELRGKRNSSSQRAVALDISGNQIRCGDLVSIVEGPHKGKSAQIKRMNRAQLFLYSQTRTENAGIFVVRSKSCMLTGSNAGRNNKSNEAPYASPRQQQGGGGPGGRGKQDDGLMGKTIRIQSGRWKGYLGCVCDATPTHVQVELHSRLKKIMVARERVAVAGDRFGATDGQASNTGMSSNVMGAPATPFMGFGGGSTPMHGAATPMHGAATPMHDGMSGGFTPSHSVAADDVWRPDEATEEQQPTDSSATATTDAESTWGANGSTVSSLNDDLFSTTSDSTGGWGASSSADQSNTWMPSTDIAQPTQNSFEDTDTSKTSSQDKTLSNKQDSADIQPTNNNPTSKSSQASTHATASDSATAAVWFMERVCVQTKNSSTGYIKEINHDKSAIVELDGDKSTITVRPNEVSLIAPKEHDMVLVTGGADVGVEGELVCIDGNDAILKDSNEDFKIVELFHLAKISGE